MKNLLRCMLILSICLITPTIAYAKENTEDYTISFNNPTHKKVTVYRYFYGTNKWEKIKTTKKSSYSVKSYLKGETIRLKVKSNGKVIAKYKKVAETSNLKKADRYASGEIFNMQNKYRTSQGKDKLEWSEDLYKFALMRAKWAKYRSDSIGIDEYHDWAHDNFLKRMNEYFSKDFKKEHPSNNNIYCSMAENAQYFLKSDSDKDIFTRWTNSKGHNRNILKNNMKIGAIAIYGRFSYAEFLDVTNDELDVDSSKLNYKK